jgi:signal transduction histidine kinase
VRAWLDGLLSLYGPACDERRIVITSQIEDLLLVGERSLLDRAVCNLLDNAISHGARGGRVDLRARRTADGVEIAVSDAGPGISDIDGRRVFERFVRLDPARSSPGPGLGLSVALAIARAHGGALRLADSALGGACFVLSIPGTSFD